MKRVQVVSVGVLAPGLAGWPAARARLLAPGTYVAESVSPPAPQQLAAAERRRVSANARWALAVVDEALAGAAEVRDDALACVFASADGDGDVLAQMLVALATPPVAMSPTLFHNSVFNAPAGYCSIAQRLTGPSTTLCAGEFTVAAALVEACDQVLVDGRDVLCVVVDTAYPAALAALRAPVPSFAAALLLRPADDAPTGGLGTLSVRGPQLSRASAATTLPWGFSDANAAGLLPVLAAIARARPASVTIPAADGGSVTVEYAA